MKEKWWNTRDSLFPFLHIAKNSLRTRKHISDCRLFLFCQGIRERKKMMTISSFVSTISSYAGTVSCTHVYHYPLCNHQLLSILAPRTNDFDILSLRYKIAVYAVCINPVLVYILLPSVYYFSGNIAFVHFASRCESSSLRAVRQEEL